MTQQLKVSVGQYSDKGRKEINQDFYGFYKPPEPQLSTKGIAFAMADGISSSDVSQIASETAVKCFLDDYFCTSDAWSVRHSAHRVLAATNSWLHTQSNNSQFRFDKDKGYVCTLSAMVFKSTTAHIFHVGDTRIYRLQNNALEQLTKDHRLWVSQDKSYLSRALGTGTELELDYQLMPLNCGDIFILATDGVYEHTDARCIISAIKQNSNNLNDAAKIIVKTAFDQGSPDNLTLQIIRVDSLPQLNTNELHQQIDELPFPHILEAREQFDGYTILREVHATSRSHVYLAQDSETNAQVIIKTPSIDLRNDPKYLERFLMEEWIARRINNAHVLKAGLQTRKRNFIYTVTEFIEGQTLTQWLIDNPQPDLETIRGIVEQIARGLRALHRMEILHQDLKPDNIMIDSSGTVKIIDFGSARVAGIVEASVDGEYNDILGTALYTAPEYFLGEGGSQRSDLYSLAVITYHMISREFPYGTQVAKARTAASQRRLSYHSVLDDERETPAWVDETLRKALHPNPYKRYEELSEFLYDLRQPNKAFLSKTRPPLIERSPVAFWQSTSLILSIIIVILLIK
ncbi:bifunctional protein-serine/threonine kinase/phosphatase [Neptunomonas qingdaonensis]|uniref:Serine/threonine protein phosphatase PrpC n=1 Tax=Neptunomonas qingdaonensis TaxID=1045558 RepID=A0A1I2PW11_9GAMM|nr:bifunctional protein-serine/threonine kinase/phosphatase [Neptunomonas qingdaonensis]SFG19790.1 Serine/threonine protein phosphatase PrpC [Neptunomonas qingdaonensis]